MKHLVVGDIHGYWNNLREFLLEQGAIDEHNQRINQDELKVYCSGDLIDGSINRQGDLILLEYAPEWFDGIVVGNHEYAFIGGPRFTGIRDKDFPLIHRLAQLTDLGLYVPALLIEDYLVVHGGLAKEFIYYTAEDAYKYIMEQWEDAPDELGEQPILDWIGPERGGKYSDDHGGVVWCDWYEERNPYINQIVGHTTFRDGPRRQDYSEFGTTHWNIDVGGKHGDCIGGVIIENGTVTPVFWGERFIPSTKVIHRPKGGWTDDRIEALLKPYVDESVEHYKQLMEETGGIL